MKKHKVKSKIKSIEDAIIERFPEVTIYEVSHTKFGTKVLGVVPARSEFDTDHIVEWLEDGKARECLANSRDYREVGWNEEEQKPEYIHCKLLVHNEAFNVTIDASN